MPFETTHWSLVLQAGEERTDASHDAFNALCAVYWTPLYVYVRRKGNDVESASDLVQSFFASFIEHNGVSKATPERGKFRSFLLRSIDNFLINEWAKGKALKRPPSNLAVTIDHEAGEKFFRQLTAREPTPRQAFERQWAITLLDKAYENLETSFSARGKETRFAALSPCLTISEHEISYEELSRTLGMTNVAIRVAIHRMRRRYQEEIRELVRDTVASESEVDGEIDYLIQVFDRYSTERM